MPFGIRRVSGGRGYFRQAQKCASVSIANVANHTAGELQVAWQLALSISEPIRLHNTRRKYSWRGNDMNERESVSIPMKRESNPQFESAFNCHSIPSFWSRNHQPLPN